MGARRLGERLQDQRPAMICPRCLGRGEVPVCNAYMESLGRSVPLVIAQKPCDYPGCHGGHLHCCEGDQANDELVAANQLGDLM